MDHDDSVGMAGKGGPAVANPVVLVGHLVDGAFNVELLPIVGHLGKVVAEMDEDVTKSLMGTEVLLLFFLRISKHAALDCHAITGPQADFVELDPFDLGASEEHGTHGAVADRQGFGHPGFCGLIIP